MLDAGEGDAVVPELEPELLPFSMGWTTGVDVDAVEVAALGDEVGVGATALDAAFGCLADGNSDSGASCATTKEEHSATKAPPISR